MGVGVMLRDTLQLLGFPSLVVQIWFDLMAFKMYTVKTKHYKTDAWIEWEIKLHLHLNMKPDFFGVPCCVLVCRAVFWCAVLCFGVPCCVLVENL